MSLCSNRLLCGKTFTRKIACIDNKTQTERAMSYCAKALKPPDARSELDKCPACRFEACDVNTSATSCHQIFHCDLCWIADRIPCTKDDPEKNICHQGKVYRCPAPAQCDENFRPADVIETCKCPS